MEEGPKSNGRRSIVHIGKSGKRLVIRVKTGTYECAVCGQRWSAPANGNDHRRQCPRGCTEEDLHTKVWTRENSSQEELERLVPKETRFRFPCWGGLNLDMDPWIWKREIKRV